MFVYLWMRSKILKQMTIKSVTAVASISPQQKFIYNGTLGCGTTKVRFSRLIQMTSASSVRLMPAAEKQ